MISMSESNEVSYKFTKKIIGSSLAPETPGKVSIELKEDLDLEELFEMFESFLVASGFRLEEGEKVGIISDEERGENFSE